MISGSCEGGCGTTVTRERVPEGAFGAEFLNALPLLCESCADRQSRLADDDERAAERAARERQLDQRIARSGIPMGFRAWTLDKLANSQHSEAVAAARRFAQRDLLHLALTGPVGVGKTTIAAAAAKQYMWVQGRQVRWLKVHEIITHLGRPFGSPEREAVVEALTGQHALVLDDLDKVKPTEHAVGPLLTAVDNCVSERRPLIVTTNLKLGELADKWADSYGDAIVSRLAGYCETHYVGGHDRRLQRTEAA